LIEKPSPEEIIKEDLYPSRKECMDELRIVRSKKDGTAQSLQCFPYFAFDAEKAKAEAEAETYNAALSILNALGLLLCFADAQKLSNGEEASVATTSAF